MSRVLPASSGRCETGSPARRPPKLAWALIAVALLFAALSPDSPSSASDDTAHALAVEREWTSASPPSVDAVGARLASPMPTPATAIPLTAFARATRADPGPAVASAPEPSGLARWTLSHGTSTSLS